MVIWGVNSILTPVDTGVVIASSPVNGGVGGVQKKGFSPFKEVVRPTHTDNWVVRCCRSLGRPLKTGPPWSIV